MPAHSKSQFRFMKAVEEGYIKKPGLSKQKAKEFTSENVGKKSPKHLAEKIVKAHYGAIIIPKGKKY